MCTAIVSCLTKISQEKELEETEEVEIEEVEESKPKEAEEVEEENGENNCQFCNCQFLRKNNHSMNLSKALERKTNNC